MRNYEKRDMHFILDRDFGKYFSKDGKFYRDIRKAVPYETQEEALEAIQVNGIQNRNLVVCVACLATCIDED